MTFILFTVYRMSQNSDRLILHTKRNIKCLVEYFLITIINLVTIHHFLNFLEDVKFHILLENLLTYKNECI